MLKHLLHTTALTAAILPASAFAITIGQSLGTDEAAIRNALEAEGYTVLDFENDDGELEFEVQFGSERFELEVDSATGLVSELESDDDDDD